MAKIFKTILIVATLVLQFGCSKEEIPDPKAERTILVYIAANNNLKEYAEVNVSDLIKGAAEFGLEYDNLIVYISLPGEVPHLYRIDSKGMHLIKDYTQQNSLDKNVMANVLSDVKQLFPAPSNGIIFGSHGFGWMPRSIFATRSDQMHPLTRDFGVDNMSSEGISAEEIASILPDNAYDFIAFDACYMGSVEVVWALRKKCNYMLVSVAEVLAEGLPYRYMVSDLFAEGKSDLSSIAQKYYEIHNKSIYEFSRSATIAVVDCNYLEAMASNLKNIIANYNGQINVKTIQIFDRTNFGRHFAYDIGDFVEHISDSISSVQFYNQLNNSIITKYSTPTLWSGSTNSIVVEKFSGLSIFIPTQQESENVMNAYKKTEWYRYIYGE